MDSGPLCSLENLLFHYHNLTFHCLSSICTFADHFILEHVCISLKRNLDRTHPLYPLISTPCFFNGGIIANGLDMLLTSNTGELSMGGARICIPCL